MVSIGKFNTLRIVKFVPFGVYLDGEDLGEILLPSKDVPKQCHVDDLLKVFLYVDSEDRPIATTRRPYATVGQVAFLKVSEVNRTGIFLNWGLPKDLLVPFAEQQHRMKKGQSYLVFVYLDEQSQRIVASAKLEKFLDTQPFTIKEDEQVELLIGDRTDLGYKVVINDSHWGLLFETEVFQPLRKGQRVSGYIQKIRPDGKIDCGLHRPGYDKVQDMSWKILEALQNHNGFLPMTDKSSPEEIYAVFGVSKKTFKKAIGALYKRKMIVLEEKGISLLERGKNG